MTDQKQWSIRYRALVAIALALAMLVAACGGDDTAGDADDETATDTADEAETTEPADDELATETLPFALISAFSGPAADWGPMEQTSVELAIEHINDDGGIVVGDTRHMLELHIYDHAYDPNTGVTVVRQALDQDEIRYIEVLGGGLCPSVQGLTEEAEALLFCVGAGDVMLDPEYELTFRPYYDIPLASRAALEYYLERGGQGGKALFLYTDDDMGQSLGPKSADHADDLGFETETMFLHRDETDFSAVVTRVRDSAPDIIDFGPVPPSQYAQIIRQAREFGWDGTFVFSDTVDLDTVVEVAGADAVAGSLAAPMWQEYPTERGERWAREYEERYGSVQSWTGQAYDNLWLLKAAIEEAGTLDTRAVADALGHVRVEGAFGTVFYGGEEHYGLPRILVTSNPVAEITVGEDGSPVAEQVYMSEAN